MTHARCRRLRRLKRKDRGADIAAELRIACRPTPQDVRDQRRRRRFAVGAGDGDEGRARRQPARARGRTARCRRSPRRPRSCASSTGPMRFGMRQRHAGREHERGNLRPIDRVQIRDRNAGGFALSSTAVGIVVAGDDVGAAGDERSRARPGPSRPSPNTATFRPAKSRDRDHGELTAASGSRARPARARPRRSRSG